MKFRSTLLLSAVALLGAMPAWADTLSSSPSVASGKYQFIAASRADFALDASKDEAFRADPFSSDALRFQASQPGAGSDLVSLKSSGALSSASSKSDEIRASDFMKLDSYRGGTGEGSKTGTQSEVSPSVVPEPETLSLLLLGLTAIGSAALRRR
jgi:hypothetical protein